MNAIRQAENAYRQDSQPLRTNRRTEYEAFARITHRLKSASTRLADRTELANALHQNRRLWATLAADVAIEQNALSPDLRARILYLAEFTRRHSSLVLRGAPVDPLLEINTSIMSGLRQRSDPT